MPEGKSSISHLTDENFDNEVKNSTQPILVDFWAPWCGPCRMLAPILERIAERFAGKMRVAKINIDENPAVTSKFGIMSIPTLILFQGGKEVDRTIGALPEGILAEKLTRLLGGEETRTGTD